MPNMGVFPVEYQKKTGELAPCIFKKREFAKVN